MTLDDITVRRQRKEANVRIEGQLYVGQYSARTRSVNWNSGVSSKLITRTRDKLPQTMHAYGVRLAKHVLNVVALTKHITGKFLCQLSCHDNSHEFANTDSRRRENREELKAKIKSNSFKVFVVFEYEFKKLASQLFMAIQVKGHTWWSVFRERIAACATNWKRTAMLPTTCNHCAVRV